MSEQRRENTEEDRKAWDQFAAAYVAARTGMVGHGALADNAAQLADALLARRRERFG